MSLLTILRYPDARLHTIAQPISDFNQGLQRLIADMAETMYAAPGIGLAATQVNVHRQLIVIDISETKDDLLVFINPKLLNKVGDCEREEGCLSVPGIYDKVRRAERITVTAQDAQGAFFTLEAEGLLAICIQHEMDHLQGKVFVEHLSRLKQNRILAKIKKHARETM